MVDLPPYITTVHVLMQTFALMFFQHDQYKPIKTSNVQK